jgi:hypothetical protein
MMPAVASLTDDNEDGRIDEDDVPDIVVVTYPYTDLRSATLRVVSGDGTGEHFSVPAAGLQTYGGVALGDIDGDGISEIVGVTISEVIAFEHTGAVKWISEPIPDHIARGGDFPSIADMDGDGSPEIIVGRAILSADGRLVGAGAHGMGAGSVGSASVAVDLDQDGSLELVVGNALYAADGTTLQTFGSGDGFPAVADFDGDGAAEIVISGMGLISLYDTDGTELWQASLPDALSIEGGPPVIADFDGDALPEVGVATRSSYTVFDTDGTLLWMAPTDDRTSAVTGAAAFDFDGDGAAEVVYADETRLWIFSGLDGTVRLESEQHSSGTVIEYPVVADVDGDGEAELVVPNATGRGIYGGVSVWGAQDAVWPPTRKIWNQHAYYNGNVEPDGGIPGTETSGWLAHNTFRSGDLDPSDGMRDLVPLLDDVCLDCASDSLTVTARIANGGMAAVVGELELTLVGHTADEAVVLDTVRVAGPVEPGRTLDSVTFIVQGVIARGIEQLSVRVDDSETTQECDETNNHLEWPAPLSCP